MRTEQRVAQFGTAMYLPAAKRTTVDPLDQRPPGRKWKMSRCKTEDAEQGSEMTEPTTSFADSGEAVISQRIEVSPDPSASNLSADEFAEYYDVERTVDEIVKCGYKCVCLIPFWRHRQHPTNVLSDCTPVSR